MPVVSLANYTPAREKSFLFDANIWISICWPDFNAIKKPQDIERNKIASSFFSKCISTKSIICISSIITSEIINRIYRKEYEEYCSNYEQIKYKDFRQTKKAIQAIEDIQQVFSSQLIKLQSKGIVEKVEDNFTEFNISQAIQDLQHLDFNDSIILSICKSQGIYLVTNDSDLLKKANEITILTALC